MNGALPRRDPGSSFLFVRFQPLKQGRKTTNNYTLKGCGVVFRRAHNGWYKVTSSLGDGLRDKSTNQLNPAAGDLVFEVATYQQAIAAEERDRQAKLKVQKREEDSLLGRRPSPISEADMTVEPVGALSKSSRVAPVGFDDDDELDDDELDEARNAPAAPRKRAPSSSRRSQAPKQHQERKNKRDRKRDKKAKRSRRVAPVQGDNSGS